MILEVALAVFANGALVDAATVVPGLAVEMRYARDDNFLKRAVYPKDARCLLLPGVARRLARVQRTLARRGYGLKVWDCYRPPAVQRAMWAIVPDERYVGNPAKGSNHNRGAAVDLTLVHKPKRQSTGHDGPRDGEVVEMPTGHDDFSPRAHSLYARLPRAVIKNRETLRRAMVAAGFRPIATEWWHFNAPRATRFPVIDVPLTHSRRQPPGRKTGAPEKKGGETK